MLISNTPGSCVMHSTGVLHRVSRGHDGWQGFAGTWASGATGWTPVDLFGSNLISNAWYPTQAQGVTTIQDQTKPKSGLNVRCCSHDCCGPLSCQGVFLLALQDDHWYLQELSAFNIQHANQPNGGAADLLRQRRSQSWTPQAMGWIAPKRGRRKRSVWLWPRSSGNSARALSWVLSQYSFEAI